MPLRCFFFLASQLAGAALGAWAAGLWGALAGACAGAWLWFAWDAWRGTRVLVWLRSGELVRAPALRGLWGEAVDRTRRWLRAQEQRVQASDARLQEFLAALQASPHGVLLLDAQGHIEWANQQAAQHFGLQLPRDLQQSVGHLLREPAFSTYLTAGDYRHDVLLNGSDSTPAHPVRLAVRLHPYGDGRRLMLSSDVTQLEQADAMRRDFVANVSHEIRTPLTVLAGFVETLQTLELSGDERARYLALMAQQAERMQCLVGGLLTLSRLEGSPPPSLAQWTPVADLLQRCVSEARALSGTLLPAGSKAQQIECIGWEPGRALGEIAGHAGELYSALSNLVGNAVRYTPAGGRICVQWQPLADGSARFVVRDSGPGIAPEHLPRLTERFYRVDRSRSRETGGSGLGLAIVRHVVQRHGAQLHIDSVWGQGSTFAITFPAVRLRA